MGVVLDCCAEARGDQESIAQPPFAQGTGKSTRTNKLEKDSEDENE